jgi:predicted 2-oxoglutarate/Fe(II)-dependent dioxygenase YbiX
MIRACPYWLYDKSPLTDLADQILKADLQVETAKTDTQDNINSRASNVKFLTAQDSLGKEIFGKVWGYVTDANIQAGWNFNISTCEPFQYTEYSSTQKYDWHIDNRFDEDDTRKLSFTLLLTDDFSGGDFQFELGSPGESDRITTISMKKGDLVIFPSYVWHRVTPVENGTRKSLVGWCRGPHFV